MMGDAKHPGFPGACKIIRFVVRFAAKRDVLQGAALFAVLTIQVEVAMVGLPGVDACCFATPHMLMDTGSGEIGFHLQIRETAEVRAAVDAICAGLAVDAFRPE